jgi:hypothetical protein
MIWRVLAAMCAQEIETRIGLLPNALIRLAVLRLPRDVRGDLADEWTAELDFIVSGTDGLPVTRLLRGLRFAASLVRVAPSIAHELTCTCTQRSRIGTVVWTAWFYFAIGMATSELRIAFDSFAHSHHTATGISAVLIALSGLIMRRLPAVVTSPPWVQKVAPIDTYGDFQFAIGYLIVASALLIQGGVCWDVIGILCAVAGLSLIWFFRWLSHLPRQLPGEAPSLAS